MRTTEILRGDWVVAPFPLVATDASHTAIFKVEKVAGQIVFTKRGRKLIEVEARRLVACSIRRGETRMIYRP